MGRAKGLSRFPVTFSFSNIFGQGGVAGTTLPSISTSAGPDEGSGNTNTPLAPVDTGVTLPALKTRTWTLVIGWRVVVSTRPLIEVRTGSGLLLRPSPPEVRTVTLPVPAPKGTKTESCVAEALITVASVPPIRTILSAWLPEKPLPLMSSDCPASTLVEPKPVTCGGAAPG